MSVLKYLPPFPRPSRAERTLLPAALTALLAVGCVLLLVLPVDQPLPDGGAVVPLRLAPLNVVTPPADPRIAANTLFTPARNDIGVASASTPVAVAVPLGGAVLAGITSIGARRTAFVTAPGGTARALVTGSVYLGWQVAAIDSDSVVFVRSGDRLTLAVGRAGAGAEPPATDAPDSSEEEIR